MTKNVRERDTMYEKILKNDRWIDRPTENTALKILNPDEMVDMIHLHVDTRLWENIELYFSYGLFSGMPITRTNLDYSNYIQLERLDTRSGNGGYVIRLYSGKGTNDICFVSVLDKSSVIGLIQSIRNPKFFADWRRKLVAADFGYEDFQLYNPMPSLGAAFI